MLSKTYDPKAIETRHYDRWEATGAFKAGGRGNEAPYTIVIPPPNVTGNLHIGHALNNTLQDVLIRYERMRGRDALWQPGTDHAGIATQMVVERQLEADGTSRTALGREVFVDKVWSWREDSGGAILKQLRRLGASCDWSRERFTMDEGLSRAVVKVFVDLHKQGLIYKDKRLVNWDPGLHTAISDLEVENREVDGHLWHIRYAIEGDDGATITVATTRPETMLGDTAIAVHPEDARYTGLIGRHAILPLVGRLLPIVADDYADPEQGSGAVKITPGHDFNDFEVGRRHGLEVINIFDADAALNEAVPPAYRGLDRLKARTRVLADLEAQGLIDSVEDIEHTVPYGDRSGVLIEPWLTDQWYVDAATLAGPAIEAVESGQVVFVPKQWEKTYFEWMRNIQPWCISRQLWWGHQIPAWYGPDGHIFVADSEAAAHEAAREHYGAAAELTRDEDVLDTWFSSALWPFSTLGWPDETPELARYYPTDVLVTGFDIIFFWVARMMMMGLHFMKAPPFHTVYIHALVRDEKGAKMSKSKGNIIDPLDLVDEFGADALRFALTAMAAQGRDIKLAKGRVAGYRNFATKIWNVARFCEMNGCRLSADFDATRCDLTLNKWIAGEVAAAGAAIDAAIAAYKFNEAADAIYHFTWGTFCDWYIEFAKPLLMGDAGPAQDETRACAAWALGRIVHLLHPFMPFVTEEIWQRLSDGAGDLITAAWPDALALKLVSDPAVRAEMDWVIRLVSQVRTVRGELNVPAAARIECRLRGAAEKTGRRLDAHRDIIARLARLDPILVDDAIPEGAVQTPLDEATIVLPLAGVIDLDAERERLGREVAKAADEIERIDKKLANPGFLAKAPGHVVEEQRSRRSDAEALRRRLMEALQRLAPVG